MKLLECVPNISEGRNENIIKRIKDGFTAVPDVHVLHTDIGFSAHRTVFTVVGPPDNLVEATFKGIKIASQLIDMRNHQGEHPRMGAVDVCPFIPLMDMTEEEAIQYALALANKVGNELSIPVYLYEQAAKHPDRRNLSHIRAGEYEGFKQKIYRKDWKPDIGPQIFNSKSGQVAIGVRKLLVAYNVNLNTTDKRKAHQIACDVRESGRTKVINGIYGSRQQPLLQRNIRIPGMRKGLKAIGWYMEEYGFAQVSMNLTDLAQTDIYQSYEAVFQAALRRGVRITGSELIGMAPLGSFVKAGNYFMRLQGDYRSQDEKTLIFIAVQSMGLSTLKIFDPGEKIIEYKLSALGLI